MLKLSPWCMSCRTAGLLVDGQLGGGHAAVLAPAAPEVEERVLQQPQRVTGHRRATQLILGPPRHRQQAEGVSATFVSFFEWMDRALGGLTSASSANLSNFSSSSSCPSLSWMGSTLLRIRCLRTDTAVSRMRSCHPYHARQPLKIPRAARSVRRGFKEL